MKNKKKDKLYVCMISIKYLYKLFTPRIRDFRCHFHEPTASLIGDRQENWPTGARIGNSCQFRNRREEWRHAWEISRTAVLPLEAVIASATSTRACRFSGFL